MCDWLFSQKAKIFTNQKLRFPAGLILGLFIYLLTMSDYPPKQGHFNNNFLPDRANFILWRKFHAHTHYRTRETKINNYINSFDAKTSLML